MPEPRPKNYYGGRRIPFDKRVPLLGGPPAEPSQDAQDEAEEARAPVPAGPGKKGTPHVGCKFGGHWRQPAGLPRLECSAYPDCSEWWTVGRESGKWERGG
jgi:hypothetical protein